MGGSPSHHRFQYYSLVIHDLDDLGITPWLRKPIYIYINMMLLHRHNDHINAYLIGYYTYIYVSLRLCSHELFSKSWA